ncbi:MAG: hypothetical protein ACI9YH_000407 [Colwellia sp.]|jgi:hypothetical protein
MKKYRTRHTLSNSYFELISDECTLDTDLIIILTEPDKLEETLRQCRDLVSGYTLKSKGFGFPKYVTQNDYALVYHKMA